MEQLINFIATRDNISIELARGRVFETRDEIIANPEMDPIVILNDYLGLSPEYLNILLS